MLTGQCPSCGRRLILVAVGTPCRCPETHPVGACPAARPRRLMRNHQPCGRHVRPREGTQVLL